jgi:hypothetical protein
MNSSFLYKARVITALLLMLACGSLYASPVLLFECDITREQDLLPSDGVEPRYVFRRHAIGGEPDEEFLNADWDLGRFSDNGVFELDVMPVGGDVLTEQATTIRLALLNGRNGLNDEVRDEALATAGNVNVDGYTIDDFQVILGDAEGTSMDSHLVYPQQFDLADYEQKDCRVTWRAPAPAPCPDNPGIVCDTGFQEGVITAFSTEAHDENHGFQINAGLNDAWVNADAAFQGMFITVFPVLKLVFMAWFTFDAPPTQAMMQSSGVSLESLLATFGADDQRWITAVGAFDGNRAELNAELTTGGAFNTSTPLPVQDTDYGDIVLEFSDCRNGHVHFDFPKAGLSGEFDIQRTLDDNAAVCEALIEP